MAVSLPIARRATKCLVPGASAIYLFNEGAGTVLRDYSGNGNHGTLGAAAAAPTWTTEGLTFDGGDYVDCGTAADGSAAGLTAQIVINTTNDALGYPISKLTSADATGLGWGIRKSTTANAYGIYAYDGAGNRLITQVTACHANGTWGILTAVINGTTAALWSGTTKVREEAFVGLSPAPAQPLTIGRESHGTIFQYMAGAVAAAVIYPRALPPTQLVQNHAAVKALLAPRGVALP